MTTRPYLFVYSDDLASREELVDFLNEQDEIEAWRYDMDHCFYLLSALSANEISRRIKVEFGTEKRYIVSEVTENRQGWLSKGSWKILNSEKPEALERPDKQVDFKIFISTTMNPENNRHSRFPSFESDDLIYRKAREYLVKKGLMEDLNISYKPMSRRKNLGRSKVEEEKE